MKAIFIRDTKGRDKRGEVRGVPDGHIQNFLIKNGYAKEATSSNLNILKRVRKAEKDVYETEKAAAEDTKKKLEDDETIVNFKSKADTDSRLLGSISSKKIVEGLEKQCGIKVDKRKLELPEPIKSLGCTNMPVRLFKGVETAICVHITEQDQ